MSVSDPAPTVTPLWLAIGFCTRLPVPRVAADAAARAAAVRWFPVAGSLIGLAVAGGAVLGARVDPWLGALVALALWISLTGALHLDGLADLADGLGAAHGDRTRLLAVMADPHIGSFGTVAIVLQLLAKLVLLHALGTAAWPALILVPVAARCGPLAWARWLPPLKPGLGAGIATGVRSRDLIGWGLVLLGLGWVRLGLLAAPVLILLWGLYLRRRIGGVTGDAHGAGIETVETLLLLALVIPA
ncbi:adenosylcobinamide-GDP ribazoletransferase [Sphingomonas abaci]|uniref:Adenosylcobinamide-GDP ribazoletransferase n=1 Tax=Sphingomonas abaci TaxID=237611 RepID=A0A7W7AJJ4_9SPHN|nr:adenosylcobinamide-GDP ribazoletransferase [Sphingomonas abaci]